MSLMSRTRMTMTCWVNDDVWSSWTCPWTTSSSSHAMMNGTLTWSETFLTSAWYQRKVNETWSETFWTSSWYQWKVNETWSGTST